jgi:hypothetical protein
VDVVTGLPGGPNGDRKLAVPAWAPASNHPADAHPLANEVCDGGAHTTRIPTSLLGAQWGITRQVSNEWERLTTGSSARLAGSSEG